MFLLTSIVAAGWAQDSAAAAQQLVSSVAPQVVVMITKHPSNADMVEVTALDPKYPTDLLRTQCTELGQLSGDPIRGLSIFAQGIGDGLPPLIKAKFATSNLSDYAAGTFNLSTIAKAFAGAKAPQTINGMEIKFLDVTPTEATLRTFASKGVAVAGTYDAASRVLSYKLRLISQEREAIDVPSTFVKQVQKPAEKPQKPRTNFMVWGLIAVGALAAGVLVYSLLLMRGSGTRTR